MFTYNVVGYSYIQSKDLFVIYLEYARPNITGVGCEVVICKPQFIDGKLDVGCDVRVYRSSKGFVQGIEIV